MRGERETDRQMDKQTLEEISVCKHDQYMVLSRVVDKRSVWVLIRTVDWRSVFSTQQGGGTGDQSAVLSRDQSGSKLSTHEGQRTTFRNQFLS